MKHAVVTLSSTASLIPPQATRLHHGRRIRLDDFDDVAFLQIPDPPAGAVAIIGESPLPQEIRPNWVLHPSGWYVERFGTARYRHANLAVGIWDD